MPVVFDASTLVGAALKANSTPMQAVLAARARILLSGIVFDEISEVLARPEFAAVLTAERRHDLLSLLAAAAI